MFLHSGLCSVGALSKCIVESGDEVAGDLLSPHRVLAHLCLGVRLRLVTPSMKANSDRKWLCFWSIQLSGHAEDLGFDWPYLSLPLQLDLDLLLHLPLLAPQHDVVCIHFGVFA